MHLIRPLGVKKIINPLSTDPAVTAAADRADLALTYVGADRLFLKAEEFSRINNMEHFRKIRRCIGYFRH